MLLQKTLKGLYFFNTNKVSDKTMVSIGWVLGPLRFCGQLDDGLKKMATSCTKEGRNSAIDWSFVMAQVRIKASKSDGHRYHSCKMLKFAPHQYLGHVVCLRYLAAGKC